MKISRLIILSAIAISGLAIGVLWARRGEGQAASSRREWADRQRAAGNFKDAYEVYRQRRPRPEDQPAGRRRGPGVGRPVPDEPGSRRRGGRLPRGRHRRPSRELAAAPGCGHQLPQRARAPGLDRRRQVPPRQVPGEPVRRLVRARPRPCLATPRPGARPRPRRPRPRRGRTVPDRARPGRDGRPDRGGRVAAPGPHPARQPARLR